MSTNKKLIILSIALLLCITIGGTLAFTTSIEDDTNVLSTGRVDIEQLEYEREKDASGRYTGRLVEFTQEKDIDPAYLINDRIEFNDTLQSWDSIGLNSQNKLYAESVKNAIDKFVFIKNEGKTDAYIRTIIAFECPEGFNYSLIHTNLNKSEEIEWKEIGYVLLGENRYYFISATYKNALVENEISEPSLLQVLLDSKATNEDMDLLGDTFDILVKTQATQKVEDQTSEQVLNKVFGETSKENIPKWFDLRPKFDVEDYDDLTDSLESITDDSLINIKDDIDSDGNGVWIENKNIEINGNDYTMNLSGKVGNKNYNYAPIIVGGKITFNDVNIDSKVGGMAILDGANVTFNGNSVNITNSTTNPRYTFYVAGTGTEVTINSGTFSFDTAKKRAYIYAETGTTIYINGGNFGKASTRNDYNASTGEGLNYTLGILGNGNVIIKGGTFGFNPTTWVASGYKVQDNLDGTYTVVPE